MRDKRDTVSRHERLSDLNIDQWRTNVDYAIDRIDSEHGEFWKAFRESNKVFDDRIGKLMAAATGLLVAITTASVVMAITILATGGS